MDNATRRFTAEDCTERGYGFSLAGKVIVISQTVLPEDAGGQLVYCTGGNGSKPNPIGRSVFGWSLSDGEHVRWWRQDVVGVLNPELLPDNARLQMSQLRPTGNPPKEGAKPVYFGYCFLPDGRYTSGLALYSGDEVKAFAQMQSPWQHRLMVCDSSDNCVLEMTGQAVTFPEGMQLEDWPAGPAQDGPAGDGIEMRGWEG